MQSFITSQIRAMPFDEVSAPPREISLARFIPAMDRPECRGHLQHLGGGLERVGDGRALVGGLAGGQFLLGHHEAAADRVIDLLQDHVALGIDAP